MAGGVGLVVLTPVILVLFSIRLKAPQIAAGPGR
jgi:hypothetical protein